MKRVFVTLPMLWPRLSDRAAAQLLEIVSQLLEAVQHHYGPQAWRWQRQQGRPRPVTHCRNGSESIDDDNPF